MFTSTHLNNVKYAYYSMISKPSSIPPEESCEVPGGSQGYGF